MSGVLIADPVAAIRARARRERSRLLPLRLCRWLADAWLRRLERQMAMAVRAMEHDGVMEDDRRVARG